MPLFIKIFLLLFLTTLNEVNTAIDSDSHFSASHSNAVQLSIEADQSLAERVLVSTVVYQGKVIRHDVINNGRVQMDVAFDELSEKDMMAFSVEFKVPLQQGRMRMRWFEN